MSLDRRTLLKASALGVGGLAATAAVPSTLLPAAHAARLPSPSFSSGIEGYERYEGQKQCIGAEQAGVAAFKRMVLGAYPGTRNLGIIRACGVGGTSEHKEGRAWDWGVYATRSNEAAAAQEVINWLLATDAQGNRHANARRLGLMYMIWNRKVWKAYSSPHTWHTYTGSNPHTDHIHFSFGWRGARKQTSFWTAAAPQDNTGPSWSKWTGTATATWSAPAATSWSSRRTDVFATNGGRLLHRWFITGRGWGPGNRWQDLGRPSGRRLTSQPAAASRGEGLLDVFARADDGRLWRRSYSPQSGWSEWASLGGSCQSAPAAVSWGADHVAVAVLGPGGLHTKTWNGSWGDWESIPSSPVTTGPALASSGRGVLHVFARGRGGDLVHAPYSDGRWHGFVSLGGQLAHATPAATSMEPGSIDAFVIGTNDAVYHKRYRAGSWLPDASRYDGLGGRVKNGLAATSLHASHVEVFAQAGDGRLYQRWMS